jgi:hypothetical protein
VGYWPAGWGASPWVSLLLGAVALVAIMALVGRRVEGRDQIELK